MGKSVFILLCMLYRSFVFCTAQQVDMLHNMFRSSYEGNQVVKIDDAADESPNYSGAMHFRDAANEETEYTYDANGNMLTDSNKGITSIDYNVLDLPQCIKTRPRSIFKESTGNAIYYTYSAGGTKLRATYKEADSMPMSYKPNASYNNNTGLNIKTGGMVTPMARPLKSNYHYCSNLVYNNDRLSTILFDGGYASVDESGGIVMHFYVKDHLGSNRLVVDGNGNIEEVNHYYPFGALMGDRCGVSRNKYKYIGKELDTMYGWNMQDHEARWYDPVLGRWMATDPLQEKYASVSSYCYCINNPIRYVDMFGLEPTEEEAARIADHVYGNGHVNLIGGWKLSSLSIEGVKYVDNKSGFKSALYERTQNGKIEYVYATAGTDFKELNDWINNIKQIVGRSEQYNISMKNANIINKSLHGKELTFVGHSLGGGLAAANAYKTKMHAITFNAAWVSPLTVSYNKHAKIDAYIHIDDELDYIQRIYHVRANGTQHFWIERRSLLGHSIKNFYRSDAELILDKAQLLNKKSQSLFIQNNKYPF